MPTTTTLVSWTPQVVTGPIAAAHITASAEAVKAAQALAPGRIQVRGLPMGSETTGVAASGPGVVQQEYGAAPHEISPKAGKVLAGKGFGPVGGTVDHPGNTALHFTNIGAQTYVQAFIAAAKRLLPG